MMPSDFESLRDYPPFQELMRPKGQGRGLPFWFSPAEPYRLLLYRPTALPPFVMLAS